MKTSFNAHSTMYMKKTRFIFTIILIIAVSISCADDNEFNNLIGSWVHPPSQETESFKAHPDLPSYECEEEILIRFNKSLIGTIDKHDSCGSEYDEVNFEWKIKGDELTIILDQQPENNYVEVAGLNTFEINGNRLTITGEDGTITEFSRKNSIN
jgi:hypothetical protein